MSEKTNAARLLDNECIDYDLIPYETSDDNLDGKAVAKKLGIAEDEIFKTLVTRGKSGQIHVFVIPVSQELDLKKAAKATGEKSIQMIPVKEILSVTGYVKGGCSPLGMKKTYSTIFDETIVLLDRITFNAGKIGFQLQLSTSEISRVLDYQIADVSKD